MDHSIKNVLPRTADSEKDGSRKKRKRGVNHAENNNKEPVWKIPTKNQPLPGIAVDPDVTMDKAGGFIFKSHGPSLPKQQTLPKSVGQSPRARRLVNQVPGKQNKALKFKLEATATEQNDEVEGDTIETQSIRKPEPLPNNSIQNKTQATSNRLANPFAVAFRKTSPPKTDSIKPKHRVQSFVELAGGAKFAWKKLVKEKIPRPGFDIHEYRETMSAEKSRLVKENAGLAKTLATLNCTLEEVKGKYNLEKRELTIQENARQLQLQQSAIQREKMWEIRRMINAKKEQYIYEYARFKTMTYMENRSREETNYARMMAQTVQIKPSAKLSSNIQSLRDKLRNINQITETYRQQIREVTARMEKIRDTHTRRYKTKQSTYAELQRLRRMQVETVTRRKEITLVANGDLTKRQEDRLKKVEQRRETKKTMVGGILANLNSQVTRYERTMKRIQAVTGITNINAVCQKFFHQETKRIRLDKEIIDLHIRLDKRKSRLDDLNEELDHIHEFGIETDNEDQVSDLSVLETKHRHSIGRCRYMAERYNSTFYVIVSLVSGLLPLARMLLINVPTILYKPLGNDALVSHEFATAYANDIQYVLEECRERLMIVKSSLRFKDGKPLASRRPTSSSERKRLQMMGLRNQKTVVTAPEMNPVTESSQIIQQVETVNNVEETLHGLLQQGENMRRGNVRVPTVRQRETTGSSYWARLDSARESIVGEKATFDMLVFEARKRLKSTTVEPMSPMSPMSPSEFNLEKSNIIGGREENGDDDDDLGHFGFLKAPEYNTAQLQNIIQAHRKGTTNEVIHDHNERMLKVMNLKEDSFAQALAIAPNKFYAEYMKQTLKGACLSRDQAKLLSVQLLTQDSQASKFRCAEESFRKRRRPQDVESDEKVLPARVAGRKPSIYSVHGSWSSMKKY